LCAQSLVNAFGPTSGHPLHFQTSSCGIRATSEALHVPMSYSTLNRHGDLSTSYAHARGGVPSIGVGDTWWPDFGPTRDFSVQERSHPCDSLFEHVKRAKRSSSESVLTGSEAVHHRRFRNPQPSRAALLNPTPAAEVQLAAHTTTERQASLRRAEEDSRRMEACTLPAPIHLARLAEGLSHKHSSIAAATEGVATYQKHGYLFCRKPSSGNIGQNPPPTLSTSTSKRSLSSSAMFCGDLFHSPTGQSSRKLGPKRPSKQWRELPERNFLLDPRNCLPVSRDGHCNRSPMLLLQASLEPKSSSVRSVSSSSAKTVSSPSVRTISTVKTVSTVPAAI